MPVSLPRVQPFSIPCRFRKGLGITAGIKSFEPALEHPVAGDPILRFGGRTDPSLPWPKKSQEENAMEKMIEKTIQKSIQKFSCRRTSEEDSDESAHSSCASQA